MAYGLFGLGFSLGSGHGLRVGEKIVAVNLSVFFGRFSKRVVHGFSGFVVHKSILSAFLVGTGLPCV
jgi:hypothetical protein